MRLHKFLLTFIVILLLSFFAKAQVTTTPAFPTQHGQLTIIYDATKGTLGLQGASKVYMHAGAISSPNGTAWTNVVGNWGKDDGIGQMTKDPANPNIWRITISPRTYFNVTADQTIYRIGMVFREGGPCGASGQPNCKEGKSTSNQDIFVDLYPEGLQVSIISPADSIVLAAPNSTISIEATASANATLTLFNGDTQLTQTTGTQLSYSFTVTHAGEGTIKLVATDGTTTKEDYFYYIVTTAPEVAAIPTGIKNGINYSNSTSVILSLYLPHKNNVFVIGEFNNWRPATAYQMKRTLDGNRYWLELTGLTPGQEYSFQYLVDGNIRIGDPYADKLLNENDLFINSTNNTVYPDLKPYPTGKTTGPVSVLQTNQQTYPWQVTDFQRPAQENLVIYELLVRDFVGTHSYKTIADTLTYLKKLGINAIELMPIMEFSGNESWGYNPIYYFAPDKYYGTKNDLKYFIDKAHQLGIAVILDMVLNQADYEFPYVKAYWEKDKPAANSPYFNQQATHPFSVFFDFNHESPATKAFVDTINAYWLKEYKFDGFRFDLSKGFTQKNTGNDVAAWSAQDDSRIAIWKRIYDQIRTYDQSAYVILEHLGANEEEKILADYGMMLWGNMQSHYKEAALGYENDKANLNWTSYKQRNWNKPNLIAYMESHDEERLMYEQQLYGRVNTAANYNTKSPGTALDRMKLISAFYFTIPGPKMIWQFGEQGYDLSINRCPDGTIKDDCRVANKPPKWEYLTDANRNKLFKVYAELIKLKTSHAVFSSPDFTVDASGRTKRISINHSSMNVSVIGNFGVDTVTVNAGFQNAGKWYDYFNGDSISVADINEKILLQPGEFHLFTTTKLTKPESGIVPLWTYTLRSTVPTALSDEVLNTQTTIYPNPNAGKMTVKIENNSQNTIILNVYDLRGKMVQTIQLRKWQPLLKQEINLEKQPMGIYLLEIIDGQKKTIKKIYKN